MKHGRLASEVPKGFFRAVFGVPRMRASVCSVVTFQYAFPLNPLKSQTNSGAEDGQVELPRNHRRKLI